MKLRFLTRSGLFLLALGCGVYPATVQSQLVAKAEFVGDGSFTLPTAGEGALRRPRSLAWEGTDQIHVADERGPVAVFTAGGAFVRSYGAGTLKEVASLAIDPAGRAYVLDPDQKVVFVFDSTGQVVHQIGSPGGSAGQLDEPLDVAVGPAGFVYVLDKGRHGVQVFGLDGTFVHDVVLPIAAGEPRALAVSSDGEIYVVDKDMPNGLFQLPDLTVALATVDAPPPEIEVLRIRAGVMEDPVSVVASQTGTIAMGDRDTGVLWSLDGAGGAPVGSDDRLYGGSGSGRGSFRKLEDIALAGSDELLILDGEGRKIERIRLVQEATRAAEDPMDYPVQFQTLPPPLGQGILATAARPSGTIWYAIADAEGRNLRVVEAMLTDWIGVFGNRIRQPEPQPGSAIHAFGQVVERAGHVALNDTLLVVTEPRRNRFHVFDLRSDAHIGSFGDNYADDRRLRDPRGVALFTDGRIAVADHGNDRVAVFSADLASLLGTVPLLKAEGVTASADGRLFAWDDEGLRVSTLPPTGGTFVRLPASVSSGGVGALTVDAAGNLYALRRRSGRVAILNAGMDRLLARVGSRRGIENGDHLSVDLDGNIYATDLAKGTTMVVRWGVDLPPVRTLSVVWGDEFADMSWDAVPGSFVTGYQIEGVRSLEGPWSRAAAPGGLGARVQDPSLSYYRVAARTLTGAVGRPSPVAPVLHLAALAAFGDGDWERARALVREALATVAAGRARADGAAMFALRWAGFVSAHELEDYGDVLTWQRLLGDEVPADHEFERLFRLTDTEQRQGNLPGAVQRALAALAVPAGASVGQLSSLRQLVFTTAWELKAWDQAAAMGEEIMRVTGAADPSLRDRVLRAHLENGSQERAQELIEEAYAASPTPAERHRLETLELITAAALGDYTRAMELATVVGNTLDADLFISYQGALAAARVQTGDRPGARFELMSLLEDPRDAGALEDAIVARSVLLVYGSYIEDGQAEDGRNMLDSLIAALPPELSDVRASILQRADSVAVVADTRAKLGEGFQLYRDALFRDALRFLQEADERTDLDVDQRLIVKELLAGVLYSFQRVPDADEVYRSVFELDPDFNLSAHLDRVRELYGLTVFADEMLAHFSEIGPLL